MSKKTCLCSIFLFFLIVSTCLNLTSCNGTLDTNTDSPVVGTWILSDQYTDGYTILYKSNQLDPDKYGFIFHPNGEFTERKNAGWCGTPPIYYADFDGYWWKNSENVYQIDVEYWGGRTNYRIEIVSHNTGQLQIKYHYSD